MPCPCPSSNARCPAFEFPPARRFQLQRLGPARSPAPTTILTVMGNGISLCSEKEIDAFPEWESESGAQSARHSKVERRAFNARGRLGWRGAPVKWRSSPASIHNPIWKKSFSETIGNRFCRGDPGTLFSSGGRAHPACAASWGFTRSRSSLDGLKYGTRLAGTSTRSPVLGFRPMRGLR
jgi:hypothetical protein